MNDTPNSVLVPPATGSKWTRRIMIASLAVNLGVAGLALGSLFHGGPGRGDMVRDMGFGPYDAALRPEDRTALRTALRSKTGDLKAARAEFITDAQAILAALRAEPFNPAALGAAMAGQRDHFAARMKLGSDTIRDYLAGLPQKDRLDFADRLEQRLLHGRRGGEAPPVN
jgi:uncharacterized membrane protein